MIVDLEICIGFGSATAPLRAVNLTAFDVGQTAAYVGANHILSVDGHFHDYVEQLNWAAFPTLPAVPHFPHHPLLTGISSKTPSTDVAGMIGEGITAIVLKQLAQLQTTDIVTLEASRTVKTPDFAVQLPANWLANAGISVPNGVPAFPAWWPVEAKACQRLGNSMRAAAWRGLQQLVSYWRRIRVASSAEVGFGIVVVFKYDNLPTSPPQLRAHVFLPLDQAQLLIELEAVGVVAKTRATLERKGILYGI